MWRIMDLVAGITLICQNQLNNPQQHSNQSLLRSKGAIDDWNIPNSFFLGSEILKGIGSSCKEKICWKDMKPTQLPISGLVPISQILFHILPIFCPPAAPKQVLSVSTLTHNLCHIFCCTVAHLNWSPNFVKSFKYVFNWKKRFVLYSSLSYWARASFSGAWTKTKGSWW